jgi:Tol biopolymer transport system component
MSPEQAKGKSADRRADIWSFGVVLAEMLSGKPIYSGETAGEIMASIIKDDPPVGSLPPSTSPAIRYLIERCLNKDPQQRLQHMGEARILLQNPDARNLIGSAAPAAPAPSRSSRLSWILAGALALALAALAWIHFRETQPVERSVRFQIEAPGKSAIGAFRLSPDGRYLAYIAGSKVWVRALDSLESKVLDQTDGATYPFWSPDGQNIGFFASGKLKRIPRIGGVVQTLCDASAGRGGTWNRDGVIVFSVGPNAPLFRVSAAGGTPVAVTKLQGASAQLEGHRFPEFLPDGRHFLYLGQSANPETSGIFAGSLDGSVVRVSPIFSSALFAPGSSASATGFLLFRKSDTLMAQVFDPVRLQAAGDAFPVAERTGIAANTNTGFGAFAAAGDGTLAISAGGAGNQQLVWTDRRGKALAVVNDGVSLDTAGERDSFSLSPDDRKIVFTSGNNEDATLWLQNLGGGTPARFTFAAGRNGNAIWSPDGSRIVYGLQSFSGYSSELIVKPSNGSGKEEVLLGTGLNRSPYDWSRDGKWIAFRNDSPSADLWLLPLEGDRKPVSFLETPAAEINAHFSPDGKFLVYQSDESGRPEVYVQPVPPNGSKWQVSKAGGESPHWKGSEIFFAAPDQKLMAAQVKTAPTFDSGTPQSLFEISGAYDVASDGQHFLIAEPATGDAARLPPVTIITHWH